MIIRKVKLEDCEACLELSKTPELAMPNGKFLPLDYFKEFIKENQIFLVADKNKEIIDFVMGERTSGDIAIFHSLIVKKEFRNKGIRSKLMRTAEEECKKRKLRRIMLYGFADNERTINFFEKHRYVKGALTYEFIKNIDKKCQ